MTQFLKKLDFFGRRVNLRFDGQDYFKTYCGSCSSVLLILILLFFFLYDMSNILTGKVHKYQFMIKNSMHNKLEWSANNIKQPVFGIGIRGNLLQEDGLLRLEYGNIRSGSKKKLSKMYDCTKQVYDRMIGSTLRKVPSGMSVLCFNTTSEDINREFSPYMELYVCKNSTLNDVKCKSKEKIDKALAKFDVWMFSLVDETDYTLSQL